MTERHLSETTTNIVRKIEVSYSFPGIQLIIFTLMTLAVLAGIGYALISLLSVGGFLLFLSVLLMMPYVLVEQLYVGHVINRKPGPLLAIMGILGIPMMFLGFYALFAINM